MKQVPMNRGKGKSEILVQANKVEQMEAKGWKVVKPKAKKEATPDVVETPSEI